MLLPHLPPPVHSAVGEIGDAGRAGGIIQSGATDAPHSILTVRLAVPGAGTNVPHPGYLYVKNLGSDLRHDPNVFLYQLGGTASNESHARNASRIHTMPSVSREQDSLGKSGHHRKEQKHSKHDQMHGSLKHSRSPPRQGHRRK